MCGCKQELREEGRNMFSFDPNDGGQLTILMVRMQSLKEVDRLSMKRSALEKISGFTLDIWRYSFQTALTHVVQTSKKKTIKQ